MPPVIRTIVIPRTAMAGIADCLAMIAPLSIVAKLRTKSDSQERQEDQDHSTPVFQGVTDDFSHAGTARLQRDRPEANTTRMIIVPTRTFWKKG